MKSATGHVIEPSKILSLSRTTLSFACALDFGNLVYILETLFILMPSGSVESILYVFVEDA